MYPHPTPTPAPPVPANPDATAAVLQLLVQQLNDGELSLSGSLRAPIVGHGGADDEDIQQDAMARIVDDAYTLDVVPRYPKGWVETRLVYGARDSRRRHARLAAFHKIDRENLFPESILATGDHCRETEAADALQQILLRLSERELAIVEGLIDGRSIAEIGEHLNPPACRTGMFRLVNELREKITAALID